MRNPVRKFLMSVIAILLGVSALSRIYPAQAQSDTDKHYFSPDLGLTFSYPTGWEVEEIKRALIIGDPTDIQLLADGQPPDGLVIKVVEATRADFGLTDVQSLPELLATVG